MPLHKPVRMAAGMCLLKNFGMNDYRFILTILKLSTYQAKTDLFSTCEVASEKISHMKEELIQVINRQ